MTVWRGTRRTRDESVKISGSGSGSGSTPAHPEPSLYGGADAPLADAALAGAPLADVEAGFDVRTQVVP